MRCTSNRTHAWVVLGDLKVPFFSGISATAFILYYKPGNMKFVGDPVRSRFLHWIPDLAGSYRAI